MCIRDRDKIQAINLNSVRDNKKFDINAVEVLYSLPEKSFTLINDEKNNNYIFCNIFLFK